MGYAHYYEASPEFDKESFANIAKDFKKMIALLEHLGVALADGLGGGSPIITPTRICFNGPEKCGHAKQSRETAWPSHAASGASANKQNTQLRESAKSRWFAGAGLERRACGGDCSHETFSLEQKNEMPKWQYGCRNEKSSDKIFGSTKTAYKPYDLDGLHDRQRTGRPPKIPKEG